MNFLKRMYDKLSNTRYIHITVMLIGMLVGYLAIGYTVKNLFKGSNALRPNPAVELAVIKADMELLKSENDHLRSQVELADAQCKINLDIIREINNEITEVDDIVNSFITSKDEPESQPEPVQETIESKPNKNIVKLNLAYNELFGG